MEIPEQVLDPWNWGVGLVLAVLGNAAYRLLQRQAEHWSGRLGEWFRTRSEKARAESEARIQMMVDRGQEYRQLNLSVIESSALMRLVILSFTLAAASVASFVILAMELSESSEIGTDTVYNTLYNAFSLILLLLLGVLVFIATKGPEVARRNEVFEAARRAKEEAAPTDPPQLVDRDSGQPPTEEDELARELQGLGVDLGEVQRLSGVEPDDE